MIRPILLCTATRMEGSACWKGILGTGLESRFEVLRTGMGLDQARDQLQRRLESRDLPLPSCVISTGFAGSWSRELELGSWVLARSIGLLRPQNGEPELALGAIQGNTALLQKLGNRCRIARFLSLDAAQTVSSETDPNHPVAVDMESFAWAEVSMARSIPFLILRMISDTPDAPLPAAVGSLSSAWIAPTPSERLSLLARGLTQAVSSPRALGSFVLRSSAFPKKLTQGWSDFAPLFLNGF